MSKGKAKVKFIGGVLDGAVDDEFDTRAMTAQIMSYFGGVCVSDDEMRLDLDRKMPFSHTNWISHAYDVYKKKSKGKDGYFTYMFFKSITVHRCRALTQSQGRCMNEAGKNNLCPQHERMGKRVKLAPLSIFEK